MFSGVPSMIFLESVKSLWFQERFDSVKISSKVLRDPIIQSDFVAELLDGKARLHEFDMFSCVDADGKHMFPVVYINCIIDSMRISISKGVKVVFELLESYSGQSGTGKDWECIVLLALLLRCYSATNERYSLFNSVTLHNLKDVVFLLLPDICTTLEHAQNLLSTEATGMESCVIIAYPTYSKFPLYDIMLLVRGSGSDKYVGIQVKLGKGYPVGDIPVPADWNGGSFWVRGNAPESSHTIRSGWIYLDRNELVDFLGYSLGTLYPAEWKK